MLNLPHKDKIKLIATDFDGILTDGGLYLSCKGDESFKKINYKDIMGISIWLKNGGKFAIISGDSGEAINTLAKKFNLEDVYQGLKFDQKNEALKKIMDKYSLSPDEICYVGDDINDINALKLCKTPITTPDANYKLRKEISDIIITKTQGGFGVIREVVDSILD
ncbi:MAG: HAD hydrolase family protein [Candidatus Gastranaerophilales bacterium]|nr:HAD hydrolase family protein [Candidatus Gastranaerophilales bacterium]